MSDDDFPFKAAFVVLAIVFFVGIAVGYHIAPRDPDVLQAAILWTRTEIYVKALEDYYGFQTERRTWERVFNLTNKVEILDFDDFLEFARVNGHETIRYSLFSGKLWIKADGKYYFWSVDA